MILDLLMKVSFDVLQTVELLRKGRKGLGQQSQLFGVYGDLTGLGLKDEALDADDVADVHALEFLISFLAQVISCYVDLDAAFLILHVAE